MIQTKQEAAPEKHPAPRRLRKLFTVLVLGGAVVAAAHASAIHGSTGSAERGGDDGGSQGW